MRAGVNVVLAAKIPDPATKPGAAGLLMLNTPQNDLRAVPCTYGLRMDALSGQSRRNTRAFNGYPQVPGPV